MASTRYTVDSRALDQARSDLGLSLDVRVIFERLKPLSKPPHDPDLVIEGRYTGIDPFEGWHNLWVHKHLTLERANSALWHELTHAAQCEKLGSFQRFNTEYQRQTAEAAREHRYGSVGYFRAYRDCPLEAEAWNATALYEAGALPDLILSAD